MLILIWCDMDLRWYTVGNGWNIAAVRETVGTVSMGRSIIRTLDIVQATVAHLEGPWISY
jgi:hypothetical protein